MPAMPVPGTHMVHSLSVSNTLRRSVWVSSIIRRYSGSR